ncbi:MAG: HEAT repeat domain-containing protein [Planctomycetota bacterium]|jgi:hypothetical protein
MWRVGLALSSIVLIAHAGTDIDELVRQLGDADNTIRVRALQALIKNGEGSVPKCMEALRDKQQPPMRRWFAAKVLGGLKAKEAVPLLLASVEDRDWRVAAVAADELGRMGDKSVLPKLEKLHDTVRHPQAKKALNASIVRLGGKSRAKPERVAAPIGFEWIRWAATIEEARARAKDEKKHVLAIVTPWDSQQMEAGYEGAAEVVNRRLPPNYNADYTRARDPGNAKERALLTALCCDPDLSELITKHFVPVRVHMHTWHFFFSGRGPFIDPLPRLGTRAADAHPPALIFSTADGRLLHKITNMGVFSAPLTLRTCRAVLGQKGEVQPPKGEALLRAGHYEEAANALGKVKNPDDRNRFYYAYALDMIGKPGEARTIWGRLAQGQGMWAARARLHVDPKGPYPREWITLRDFAEVDPLIPTTEQGKGGVKAALGYLLAQQGVDGSWGDTSNRFNMPAKFSLAVPRTAACVSALRAWRKAHPGKAMDAAIERGTAFVRKRWSEQTGVWHLTYALHLAVELGDTRAITALVKGLKDIEHDGGWTYTGNTARLHTFNTAPIMILLADAKAKGAQVDDAMIERGAKFLERNRLRERLFHYGTKMEHMVPDGARGEASSCFRSPLCELALHRAGRPGGPERMRKALDLFFDGLAGARSTTKIFESYVDVVSFQDAYRYFFGTYYAARAIRVIGDKELAAKLRTRILGHQEIDGSFVDGQMVGKSSSTAFALLSLAELR